MQVDNMHARLYMDMIISQSQRDSMAAYWIAWKRRRHRLDTLLDTACDHLRCLPVHLDLSRTFLSNLAALCRSSPHHSDVAMHTGHAYSVINGNCSVAGAAAITVGAEAPVATETGKGWGGCEDVAGRECRFLGQNCDVMMEAHGALRVLRDMHMQDRDMHTDNLAAQMPGVFVNTVQVSLYSVRSQ
jgi:hypothetical protein